MMLNFVIDLLYQRIITLECLNLCIGCVSSFPLDYMHLVCLGVAKISERLIALSKSSSEGIWQEATINA